VAAYHAGTDRVLLMDVARYKYKPAWVPVKQMFQAMTGIDSTSKLSRGWMLVQAGS
jgi:glutathione gamma-glutamylcysteinyltransferase